MPLADRATLNNLIQNLDIGDVADPALRLAYFQYMTDLSDANWTYMTSLVSTGSLTLLRTTADLTYYVRADGNDANTGLADTAGAAFETIGRAISMIPQIVNHAVNIHIASGTYAEDVLISGFTGRGYVGLLGDSVLSNSVNVHKISVIGCGTFVYVQGFYSSATDTQSFTGKESISVRFEFCKTDGVFADAGFQFTSGGFYYVTRCLAANKQYALSALLGSRAVSEDWNASSIGNTFGLRSETGAVIAKNFVQPVATTPEITAGGGDIR